MAKEVKAGLEEGGCEVILCRAPELLSREILDKMHAPPTDLSIPECCVADLAEADGIMFGIATRFGMANAQLKSLWDSTGSLWQEGALAGKPAAIFVSTATQGGGQETTALTWVTQLTHHGMLFVPLGYTTPLLFNMDELHGGSPYGAGTFAGTDGSRQPTELEKKIAHHQGTYFAGIASALKAGNNTRE
eukprot:CAMPEP_0171462184 /NCGR_PEP_ID=MMETSP0945-20130129/6325_1 /TAXON_ID=109269 /ORGANISM="Vaucheria litorea, Strain CCMP2940" /LENGTH=189 /DNA_ID=CAMNT_0011988663 /DNA_START=176 /DNA_END=745 /DNA_ORIENTATION=+